MTETVTPTHFVVNYRKDRVHHTDTIPATDAATARKCAEDVADRYGVESVYPVPLVGMPATIHYVTDSSAAVVVKVNPKSVLIARVEIGPWEQDMRVDGARDPNCFPVMVAEGITDKVIGEPHRYRRMPNGRITDGSIGVTLGYSISRRDYRD